MKRKRILVAITSIFLILAAGAGVMILNTGYRPADVTEVNDAIKTAEKNIRESIPFSTMNYGFTFAILDDNETMLYRSSDEAFINIFDAIKSGGSAIRFQGGTLLLTSDIGSYTANIQKAVLWYVLGAMLLFALLCAAYAVYLDRKIVRPFSKMRVFAKNVAGGNLDVPLEMDRDNLFGAFTESFDLMRTELKRAKQSERTASESKRELVASLSHDIKTPLASIQAIIELLEVQVQEEDQYQKLKLIDQKAEQIGLLTDNLFHATLKELQVLKVSPTEQMSRILVQMLHAADYEAKLVSCEVAEAIIDCDILRTQQVFDNIFCNSYKYAGTDIKADLCLMDGFLKLTIRDSGSGILESELPFITKKYYRGKNASGKSGSGIGLYMCEYFMSQMGGYLEASNLPGGFAVSLYFKLS